MHGSIASSRGPARLLCLVAVLAAACGSSESADHSLGVCAPDSCDDPIGYWEGTACSDGENCLCDRCPTYCDALCAFSLPNGALVADLDENEEDSPGDGAADLSCLGTNELPPAPLQDITVTGVVEDFEDEFAIESAVVEAFASALDLDTPIASTVADDQGSYTIVIPVAVLSAARVSWRVEAEDQLETFHLNQAIECQTAPCTMSERRLSVSRVTSDSLAAILGTSRDNGTSSVIGDILDCNRHSLANANGRLFLASSGEPVPNAETYYFESEFPFRRRIHPWSSGDGLVGVLNVRTTELVEIQAYGSIDGVETLLSSATVFPKADAIVISDMDPLGPSP